jgi:hypothetical protein
MAKILGDVKDFEDYKQKIEKQRKLRNKTIKAVKEYFSANEIPLLEEKIIKKDDKFLNDIQTPFKRRLNDVYKINEATIDIEPMQKFQKFKNNSEKYEYLLHNDPNNSWITEFKTTKEYKLLYE